MSGAYFAVEEAPDAPQPLPFVNLIGQSQTMGCSLQGCHASCSVRPQE
jgi:hypothetical protein